jgi:hypothetical protein
MSVGLFHTTLIQPLPNLVLEPRTAIGGEVSTVQEWVAWFTFPIEFVTRNVNR